VACLGANIYIVGLNQLTDIEIDKVNKPYLPLASGAYTIAQARSIIIISLMIALGIGLYYGGFLLITILISLFLGTIYSLPPFRLKRFYFWAAFCIIAIRGLVVNFGLFLHFNMELNHSIKIPALVWMLASVIFIYSLVIAWFKDIPDIAGDRNYKINTLSIQLGAQKVFMIGNLILVVLYIIIIFIAFQFSYYFNMPFLVISHAILLLTLVIAGSRIRPADKKSMAPYYQFIWSLFFAEYIVFALSAMSQN
jgi:homogentisate phytyltransferase/homogentisate geranylgeranyltransferase